MIRSLLGSRHSALDGSDRRWNGPAADLEQSKSSVPSRANVDPERSPRCAVELSRAPKVIWNIPDRLESYPLDGGNLYGSSIDRSTRTLPSTRLGLRGWTLAGPVAWVCAEPGLRLPAVPPRQRWSRDAIGREWKEDHTVPASGSPALDGLGQELAESVVCAQELDREARLRVAGRGPFELGRPHCTRRGEHDLDGGASLGSNRRGLEQRP